MLGVAVSDNVNGDGKLLRKVMEVIAKALYLLYGMKRYRDVDLIHGSS